MLEILLLRKHPLLPELANNFNKCKVSFGRICTKSCRWAKLIITIYSCMSVMNNYGLSSENNNLRLIAHK